jgi:hypothetical protein
MKSTFIKSLSLLLAVLLQVAPLVRSFLPNLQGLAPSTWSIILKLGVGATALMGFDAVSQASSISISPANATAGQPYIGTITYSGGHAGSVRSMSFSNTCLQSAVTFIDGMMIVYSGANVASVTGTPTNSGTFAFGLRMYDSSSCGSGGNSDSRSTSLVVGSNSATAFPPSFTSSPINTCAQIGTDVQLSGGASGNPIPQYQWWQGLTPIPNATNSILTITNVQLTNSGVYTLTASNSQTAGFSFSSLPKANCYLSIAISGGTNFSAYDYTNFAPAGVPLTMYSYMTNVSTATNYYQWLYNQVTVLSTSNTLPLSGAVLTPTKSGTYTVILNSTNGGGAIISGQNYDSYWAFGYPPKFTNALPASTNVNAGSSVTLNVAVRGSLNVYFAQNVASTNVGNPNVFWYQNGGLVASQSYVLDPTSNVTYTNNATNVSLTLSGVTGAGAGSYTVVVTNYWGSITSSPVALTVGGTSSYPPTITTNPPALLSLLAGQSTNLSVTVTGTPPFSFQWRMNGANLANGGVYGGVSTNTLSLASVTTNNIGNYTVAITNVSGAVTSSVAALNIYLPPVVTGGLGSPGTIQFNANTITGLTYVVEMATNLAAPAWTPIQTNNTGTSGAITYQTNAGSDPSAFYRILFP